LKGVKLYRGQYVLDDIIASGGFATIYRAYEAGRPEEVAVKLCQRTEDPVYNTVITKEAELIQRFDHPHIVKLLPIKREDKADVFHARATEFPGSPSFFVMEHLDGGTLEAYLRRVGKLTQPEAATIGLQIARALDHMHVKNYAHNDLKLENVVFREPVEAGKPFQPVLIDFGIATRVSRPQAGTLYIMSPEQVGQINLHIAPELSQEVDLKKVDVWGFGVVLYRMLGGRLPFDARNERTLTDRIVHSRPTSLLELSADVNSYFDELIIDGCLAKNPADRLSLVDVGRELRRLLGQDGEVVAQVSGKAAWTLFAR
jgi:eukaryotic-like serine/threonine-protein kinase